MDQATTASRLVALPIMKARGSRYRSTSIILHELTGFHGDNISVRDLSAQLEDRGFGLILLLFALPNTIPLAITERDGIFMITGWLLTYFALYFFAALISGYTWVIRQLVSGIF